MSSLSNMDIPLFAGQGSSASTMARARTQALQDAQEAEGRSLLRACFEAFHAELTSLDSLDIDGRDFDSPDSLLLNHKYEGHPILSGTTLFLVHTLRYLRFVSEASGSKSPFADALTRVGGAGILGFSSGILPAVVVAASGDLGSFIAHAVQGFRVAFWVGVRASMFRAKSLQQHASDEENAPWSFVVLGMGRVAAEELLQSFQKTSSLYMTAVADSSCVTVSGRPDVLSAFAATLARNKGIVAHKTTVDALYHAPVLTDTRDDVLNDLVRRRVGFPDFGDLRVPVRDTALGVALGPDTQGARLIERVVDMLLMQPVNWDVVLGQMRGEGIGGRLINFGPGEGLCKTTERALGTTSVDATRGQMAKQEPIAIVGMAANLPGAPTADQLWDILQNGVNTVSEIPENRFKVSDYNDAKNSTRRMKAHTGNFLDNADEFDNTFFKISPREAKSMDPQQRVLLQTALAALEDAGYVPNATPSWNPERFGVYVGVATGDYVQNLRDDIDVYYSTGTLRAFLSGRISFAMQLSGPSIVVDTACSSSSIALYQGARALMNGDCDAALVGGVNIITSPDMYLGLDRGHFLSPTGQCKAFSASADGYSRSEGCALFVLKRLSDAEAAGEGDRILGVIRGVEVNQSGLAHSITYPHAATQAALFRSVLENSGVDPERVNVVEAHGTGTQAGDPNEVASLRSVLSAKRAAANPLHITSVKANIGHLEAASGAAGLAKLLLMLRHKHIPRQISYSPETRNPLISPLEQDHVVIVTEKEGRKWEPSHPGMTRVALLNNFGAAGSNTAIVVEEYVRSSNATSPRDLPLVFGLSAKTPSALQDLRLSYIDWLRSPASAPIPLSDIAYTMTARRQMYSHRIAVVAANRTELVDKLSNSPPAVVQTKAKQEGESLVIFVFSGQGVAYRGMGRGLYEHSAVFRACVDECDVLLLKSGFCGVRDVILGRGEDGEEVQAIQTAIFVLECGLARLWMSWGLKPAAVVGHSLGEYAALVAAGVLTMKDALLIVAHRARLMVQKCDRDSTGMLTVNMPSSGVQHALRESPAFSDLSIACCNTPTDTVLSGPISQLKLLKAQLDNNAVKSLLLAVPFGYHSPAMTPLLDDLTHFVLAERIRVRAPLIPVVSNVFGDVVMPGDTSVFNAAYFARHCAEPVQFERGLGALLDMPDFASHRNVWIELGPHSTCLPMLKAQPSLSDAILLTSLRKQQQDGSWATLMSSLAALYCSHLGGELGWRAVFAHLPDLQCISLPSYPLAKTKYWVSYKEPTAALAPVEESQAKRDLIAQYALLHQWVQYPSVDNGFVAVFETPITQLADAIMGHTVGGAPLCPASVYLELVLAGVELGGRHLETVHHDSHVVLRQTMFEKPLVYDESVARTVVTRIAMAPDQCKFSVGSRVDGSDDESVHMHGEFKYQPSLRATTKLVQTLPVLTRRITAVLQPQGDRLPEVFSTRTVYEYLFPRVVDYAKPYHTIQSLTLDASGMEGCATIQLPADYDRGKFVVHPVWMDTLLHVAGFVANMQGDHNDAYICTQVDAVKVFPALVDNDKPYLVYCSHAWLPEQSVMLAEAYAIQVAEPRRIVAHLKGIHFRRVRLSGLKASLGRAAGKSAPRPAKAPQVASRTASPSPPPAADIDCIVMKLVSELCSIPLSAVTLDADLAALGIDSMMSIEMFAALSAAFPTAELDARALSFGTTVADICNEVASKVEMPGKTAISEGTATPRTLIDEKLSDVDELVSTGVPDVIAVLSSVLEISINNLTPETELANVGLDSLTTIEALHALKTEFGLNLPSDFFANYPTPQAIQAYIAGLKSPSSKILPAIVISEAKLEGAQQSMITPISPSLEWIVKTLHIDSVPALIQRSETSDRLPLFFIHDGSGLVNYYDRLSSLDRDIWGIHNPRFTSSRPWGSLVDMASAYVKYILSTTSGPLLLGGWSFGGVVAYEIALQLSSRGIQVKGIILIDSPSPINHVPLSDSLIDNVLALERRSGLSTLIKRQFSINTRLIAEYVPHATASICPPLVLLRSSKPFSLQGCPDIPTWLSDRSDPQTSVAGWQSLAHCSVKVLDIPGHHFEPFHSSNISQLSLRIADACQYLESLQSV
ncbi:putative polyketide synthase [Roridomyces roridus]|uniref:Polyketide synthase n=1 Tax=Roridomyces roridus TaxID=1738132 RepID=A0AAD7BYT6_9AGAR|nr:putative polyketide synthase [Roridomyces roridus]